MKNKNYVSIDPSIVSTAVVINDKRFSYVAEHIAYNKTSLKKWFKVVEHLVTYRFHNYVTSEVYSENEILKLIQYNKTVDTIINDINDNIDPTLETEVMIEGYSYGSPEGYLIDLVTFSSLLRNKLLTITQNITIISPKSLKNEAAKLTYDAIPKNKKGTIFEYRNHLQIAGGSFSKFDMYCVMTDNKKFQCAYINELRKLKDDVFDISQVPKPIEDLNDAQIMYKIMINK